MSGVATHAVSAFFAHREEVDRAVSAAVAAGVPRDLIEVVVSHRANQAHYGGHARRLGSQAVRFGAAGALIGLLVGAVLSLEIILVLPGVDLPGRGLWMAQLLGPNVAMIVGGALGALLGWMRRRPASGPAARAVSSDMILLVANRQPPERVPELLELLAELGGRDPEVEPRPEKTAAS